MQSNIEESRLSLRESWFTLKPLLTALSILRIKTKCWVSTSLGTFHQSLWIFSGTHLVWLLWIKIPDGTSISKEFIKLLLAFCLHSTSLFSFSWTLLSQLDQTSFAKLQYRLRQDWLSLGKQHFGQVWPGEYLFLEFFGWLVEAFYENISLGHHEGCWEL